MTNILSGVLLNFIFYNAASFYLYNLTKLIFDKNQILPILTILWFNLNPANIFFSAVYSESLYSLLTFSGLFYLHKKSYFSCLVLFGLSSFCRSNGILNSGYIIYALIKVHLSLYVKIDSKNGTFLEVFKQAVKAEPLNKLILVSKLFLCLIFTFSGLAIYQFYVYKIFCQNVGHDIEIPNELIEYAKINDYKLVKFDESREWCTNKIPISYGYIQSNYWNVGFLRYWQIKQIPNFLMAFPVLLLSIWALNVYFKSMNSKNLYGMLGLLSDSNKNSKNLLNNSKLFPFALHLMVLLISGTFFMHIQVTFKILKIKIYYRISSEINKIN